MNEIENMIEDLEDALKVYIDITQIDFNKFKKAVKDKSIDYEYNEILIELFEVDRDITELTNLIAKINLLYNVELLEKVKKEHIEEGAEDE